MGFRLNTLRSRATQGPDGGCDNLRMMLEGSRQVGAKRMDDNDKGDMSAFVGIPQNLGPGKDVGHGHQGAGRGAE